MKKYLYIIVAYLCTTTVYAQNWDIGISAAPQISINKDVFKMTTYTGYELRNSNFNTNLGVRVKRSFKNQFSLISGLDYSFKNITGIYYCQVCDLGTITAETIRIGYLEVPLLLRYETKSSNLNWHFQAGLLGGKLLKRPTPSFSPVFAAVFPTPSLVQRWNVNAIIGAGLDFSLTEKLKIDLTAFYSHSIPMSQNHFSYRSLGLDVSLFFQLK